MEFSNRRYLLPSIIVVGSLLLTLSLSPLTVQAEQRTLTDQRIVLLEKFTSTTCPYCGQISPYIDSIWGSYGPGKLAIVENHAGGAFATGQSSGRLAFYGKSVMPVVVIDGTSIYDGVRDYNTYANAINTRLAKAREFSISISGDITTGTATVHIEQSGTLTGSNIKLRCRLVESDISYVGGTETDNNYNHVERVTPSADTLSLPIASGGKDYTKTFTVDPGWKKDKLSFVAFIQNDDTKEVLQGCFYGYGGDSVPEIGPMAVISFSGLVFAIFICARGCKREQMKL